VTKRIVPLADRFKKFVDKSAGPDECWPWMGSRDRHGYGGIRRSAGCGRIAPPLKAYRVAWELAVGPIPAGMSVCHRCDNPPCCNPAHLFLATHAENMADKVRKRRHHHGDTHAFAKLNSDLIVQIRNSTGSQRKVGEQFGVSQTLIGLIKRRKIWKHVP